MERLKAMVPYVVFLAVTFGLFYIYSRFLAHPAGVPRLGSHIWQDFGQKFIFLFFTYPLAILVAKRTGQLKPGAFFGMLMVIYLAIWFYIMQMLDRLIGETFFSIDGILSYEYWPFVFADLLTHTLMPVLFLVLLNHLTRRSSRTR
jgi:hypothetical protein